MQLTITWLICRDLAASIELYLLRSSKTPHMEEFARINASRRKCLT
jgi:hypothetical protein